MASTQALPSLSTLIQGLPAQDPKHQPHTADATASFESYHHAHHSKPPLPPPPPPGFDTLEPDSGSNNSSAVTGCYSMPSPISPSTDTYPHASSSGRNSFSTTTSSRPGYANHSHSHRISKSYHALPYPHTQHHHAHHAHHHAHHEEKLSKHEKRRRNHLNSEKKRRENIKSGMDALFTLVPACRDQQESKANILKKTREYILELQNAVWAAETECRRFVDENRELKRRLSTTTTATATATATATTAAMASVNVGGLPGKSRSRL